MGRACCVHWGNKCMILFVEKPEGNRPLVGDKGVGGGMLTR